MKSRKKPSSNNAKRDLLRYAGLGAQMLGSMGVAVFLGMKADEWLHSLPLFTVLLPLLVLFAILYKIFRQTGRRDDETG